MKVRNFIIKYNESVLRVRRSFVGKLNHLKKVLKATTIALAFSVSSLQAAKFGQRHKV